MSWEPLLTGDLAEQADSAVSALSEALQGPLPDVNSYSLSAGHSVVARLAELAIECPAGIAWRTEPGLLTSTNAKTYPVGRFDQGLAHGVPGVIGFLGATYERGIAREQTRALLDGALAWMYANMRP